MNILIGFLLTIHVICCVLLVLFVLMQRPRQEGLGTAFGGGVTENLFGAGAGNILTKITTWLGIIFFATTIFLAYLYSHREQAVSLREKLRNLPAAETSPAKAPSSIPAPSQSPPSPSSQNAPPPSAPIPAPAHKK